MDRDTLERTITTLLTEIYSRLSEATRIAKAAHVFGNRLPGPDVSIRLRNRNLYMKLLINPELFAAEAYMDGTLTLENDAQIHDFLLLFSVNRTALYSYGSQKLIRRVWHGLRRWHQANPIGQAAAHARHHYDISIELYQLFLDDHMQYSCAYFRSPEHDTLEQAQHNKLIHATTKLQLKPGMTVAEIGSGWGGFAIHLARETGAHVTAVNVSPEQIKAARGYAKAAGVSDRVEFRELDYRNLTGQFDRVVSVGMMEHVGIGHFDEYFRKIRELLKADGYAFIHCIGRMSQPGTTGPFIRKYIFPGAYVPALSETFAATERCGLWCDDVEVLRLHYHYTVQHWRKRFTNNRAKAAAIYDERFCRMWEFYLAAVELEFLHGSHMVFQLLLSINRGAVPITRDFMVDAERAARMKMAS